MLGAPQTEMDEIEWTDRIEEATQGIPEYRSVVITMASKQGGDLWIQSMKMFGPPKSPKKDVSEAFRGDVEP